MAEALTLKRDGATYFHSEPHGDKQIIDKESRANMLIFDHVLLLRYFQQLSFIFHDQAHLSTPNLYVRI